MKRLPKLLFLFFFIVLLTGSAKAQPPGTLTIRDQRSCEDTLFLLAEAEPLSNPSCGGPFMWLSRPLFAGATYTYDFTDIPTTNPVRWIAVSFYPTQAAACNIVFNAPCPDNFAQVGPCPAAQYSCMIPKCAYYSCRPVTLTVSYPSPGSITIIITD